MAKVITAKTFKDKFRQVFNLFDLENLTFDDHLQLNLWLLRALGFGFIDDDYYNTPYPLYGATTVLLLVYISISDIYFIKANLSDVAKVTECLTTLFLGIALFCKIGVLCFFRQRLRSIVDEMRVVYNYSKACGGKEWQIMLKRLQEARIVSRTFYYSTITVTITFICCTLPKYETSALPLPARGLGIDSGDTPFYQINFMMQIWAMIIVTHLMTGYESVFLYAILIQCGHLEILDYKVQNIGRGNQFYGERYDGEDIDWENVDFQSDTVSPQQQLDFKYTANYIRDCLRIHQKIFIFADAMNTVYTIDCLCEIVISTLVGCVSLYQVTESKGETLFAMYLYIGCCTLQIFVYCWYGDLIKHKSLQICEAIGKCPWYLLHPSQRKVLQLMLLKAQTPFTVSALFTDLTLECFTLVMKSTYSYYAVITSSED